MQLHTPEYNPGYFFQLLCYTSSFTQKRPRRPTVPSKSRIKLFSLCAISAVLSRQNQQFRLVSAFFFFLFFFSKLLIIAFEDCTNRGRRTQSWHGDMSKFCFPYTTCNYSFSATANESGYLLFMKSSRSTFFIACTMSGSKALC